MSLPPPRQDSPEGVQVLSPDSKRAQGIAPETNKGQLPQVPQQSGAWAPRGLNPMPVGSQMHPQVRRTGEIPAGDRNTRGVSKWSLARTNVLQGQC